MDELDRPLLLSPGQRDVLLAQLGTKLKECVAGQQALRELEARTAAASEELFIELLEIVDALDILVEHLELQAEGLPLALKRLPRSLDATRKKLLGVLAARQVHPIEVPEGGIDFATCRVVEREDGTGPGAQTIIKVVRQGYRLGAKVLRPIDVISS